MNDWQLSSPAALERFFAALDRLEKAPQPGPVRIIQVGDSHTANDSFSGRMREALQARFGNAGRGWLPAGVPFKYYQPRQVSVTETGWQHLAGSEGAPAAVIGIDALVACSEGAGAAMTLVCDEAEGFTRLAIEFLQHPEGGDMSLRVDQAHPLRVSTAGPTTRAVRRAIPIGNQAKRVELRAMDRRPVYLIGWTTERNRAGIIYENHGTIGATVRLLGEMSPATVAHELSDSHPALIVIAFGTNEGFDAGLDLHRYRGGFLAQVEAMSQMAPQAAILVLGPPDGSRHVSPAAGSCGWRAPPNLAAVRQIQQNIAADRGWAFWDWAQAMGGCGSMHRLVARDPPLAQPDHMHLNKAGYAATADLLFLNLVAAYEAWRGDAVAH